MFVVSDEETPHDNKGKKNSSASAGRSAERLVHKASGMWISISKKYHIPKE